MTIEEKEESPKEIMHEQKKKPVIEEVEKREEG